MEWLDSSDVIDAYRRLDLRPARHLRMGDSRGELAMVEQNAEDRYEDFSPGQFYETRAFVTFRIDL